MTEQQWRELMGRLSFAASLDTFEALNAAYGEAHRYYHTAEHIGDCLTLLAEYRRIAQDPDNVELAIWFHDAVYEPLATDNEARSAAWAGRFLSGNRCGVGRVDRVHDLIMATVHDAPAREPDAQLLVDIDLAVLGSDPQRYRKFEADVRKEYRWVPALLFKKARKKILQSFLDRETIYATVALRDRFEAQARVNLTTVIRTL